MKYIFDKFPVLVFALVLFCACFAHSQVSPFMALGNAQFFDNNGKPLTAGVLYSYAAGTTTQQATYTDSTGLTMNPNPIPFDSGARVGIWLTSSLTYKFVLCSQNDGANCAPADVLFSVDQVPACPGCSAGGNTFTGTFISGSPNPASTGILRLASSDAICWRNTAGTTNLCISKDTSDVLSWAGGTVKYPELACSETQTGYDFLCPNSSLHRFSISNNNGSYAGVPTVPTAGAPTHLPSFSTNGYDLQDSGGTAPLTTAVTFSATPTFTATSQDQLFTMTLTGNVTASTLVMTGLPTPSLVTFQLTQDATGSRTFAWPPNVENPPVVTGTANAVTVAQFVWNGTDLYPVTATPATPVSVQSSVIATLGSPVTVSGLTTVLTQAVTMPSSGCPCRAFVGYAYYVNAGAHGLIQAYVTDGTNAMATTQLNIYDDGNTDGREGSSFSPATYANSASVTFTLKVNPSSATSVTVENANAGPVGQNTWMNIAVFTSN